MHGHWLTPGVGCLLAKGMLIAAAMQHLRVTAIAAEMMAASEDYWKLKPYELSCRMNNGQPIRLGKGAL